MKASREQRRRMLIAARHNQVAALSAGLKAVLEVMGRGFFGRLKWLVIGR